MNARDAMARARRARNGELAEANMAAIRARLPLPLVFEHYAPREPNYASRWALMRLYGAHVHMWASRKADRQWWLAVFD